MQHAAFLCADQATNVATIQPLKMTAKIKDLNIYMYHLCVRVCVCGVCTCCMYVCMYAQTDLSTPISCSVCNFTSSSTKGIKIHIHVRRKHPDHPAITVNITGIVCLVSGCSFRSETTKGVKIHLRKSHKWSKELVDASFCPPT